MSIRAIYKDGVFKPLEDVSVKEGTEVDVYPREERRNGKKPKSVFDLEFFGMWKNRDEIGTGVEHVNRIRNYRREPGGSDSVAYGLASTILARSARQLPHDWRQRYGYTPLLLETLVDAERFRGTCYRAANWIHLGKTTGGSRTDRLHQARPKTSKLIFVLPLHRRAQQLLRIIDPPAVSLEG